MRYDAQDISQRRGSTSSLPGKIGVFGGTFDPPHLGHYLTALDAIEKLGLDRILVVPAANQPLKRATPGASEDQRARMAELTFQGDSRFSLSRVELERGGLSYT